MADISASASLPVTDKADGADGVTAPTLTQSVAGVDSAGNLQAILTDTSGRVFPANALIDTSNSSATPLAANATFTGVFVDVQSFSNVTIIVFTDQISAVDGLKIEYSTDGVNVDDNDLFTIAASSGQQFSFPLPARYYRVRYTNGVTLQTVFRLQSKIHAARPKPSSQRIGTAINAEQDAEVVLSAPARLGLNPGSPFTISVGVASGVFLAANSIRKGLVVVNTSNATVSFGLGVAAVLNSGITLYPGGTWNMDDYSFSIGAINAIASAAASPVAGQEFS